MRGTLGQIRGDKTDKHPHNTSLYNLFFRFSQNKDSGDPQRDTEVSGPELHKNKCCSEQLYRLSVTFTVDEGL